MKLEQNSQFEKLYQPLIPMMYVQVALHIAQERGLSVNQLIQTIGLSESQLNDVQTLVTPFVHAWLLTLIIEQTGHHGLGFEIGLRLSPTVHGPLGQAMLCCATLKDALDIASQFWQLRERLIQFQFSEHHDVGVVHLHTELVYPEPLRHLHFDCMVAMFYRITQILTCSLTPIGEIWLDYPEPDYAQSFRSQLPLLRYNMPSCQYRVPLDLLNLPLVMANAEALKHALAQCEREQSLQQQPGQFLKAVIERLKRHENGYASPEQIANDLHLSQRTFRRRLQQEGSSYQTLLEEIKKRDALHLLEDSRLAIQHISSALGYSNPANFSRTFRQWTGKTPSEYRTLIRQA